MEGYSGSRLYHQDWPVAAHTGRLQNPADDRREHSTYTIMPMAAFSIVERQVGNAVSSVRRGYEY